MLNSSISAERVAGRYQLIQRVGGGNMSSVYEAQDTRRGNRTVAVKLLNTEHDDALKQEIFRRETRALSQLEHPNIVNVLDYGWSAEYRCHYLVFPYVPRTLLDEIERHKADGSHDWCWPLMRAMADALVHAHSQGIIHRDIKPSNVLISPEGQPQLVDFGVSFLKYELSTGVTVSSFWSTGYASPEQRSEHKADERSDMYSLGCVFYHMLARRAPPANGLTPAQIDTLPAQVPEQLKRTLRRMLAPQPDGRFQQTVQLRRQLDLTQKFELLPEVYLLVTDRARRDLFDQGHIEQPSTLAACEFLLEELGGSEPKEVQLSLERGDVRLLTGALRLICARDASSPVLVIKAVHVPYQPQLEQQKIHAAAFRYLWQVTDSLAAAIPSASASATLGATLDSLFEQLSTHQVTEQTARRRSVERKDLTRMWEAVLAHQQTLLDAVPRLFYREVVRDGDTLLFTLAQPAPDDLPWPENAPVAVQDPEHPQAASYVGHVMGITGKVLRVSRDTGDAHRLVHPAEQLPSPGLIGVFQQEAKAALERQQAALNVIRAGVTVNPRLPEILRDLTGAEFDEPDGGLEFFQRDLAEDKQRAVRQALAARDLFLLQGPPGTGKTTTLAEIILQILKVKPDARILVASQSNVAVNHILSRIAELQGSQGVEIVRVGRAEKIGHGAQVWTLEQRMADWRTEVLARTDGVLAQLKERLRTLRREHKANQELATNVLDELLECQSWLEELAGELEEFPHLSGEERQQKSDALAETLVLIRGMLPEAAQGEALPQLAAEMVRLSQVIASLLSPAFPDSREARQLALVERWRKIFGKQEEFARPILERASILAATCLISGGFYLKNQEFDWAIIDEAGRATAPELLVALVRARRAIIVGDERQLPPMLDEDLTTAPLARLGTTREELAESLFATLVAQGKDEGLPTVQMLTMQHRMHPAIGQLVSTVFYGGKLTHAVDAREREHGLPWLTRPVAWFSTARLQRHAETRQGQSYYNRAEIDAISRLLHRMEYSYRELGARREVAVITPYNAQIVELLAEITPGGLFWQALSIEVATIDAFQGRDRDIVLYSTVRSNPQGTLGFLRDRRRLNVAISRAREALLLVGDLPMLEHGRAGRDGNPYQEVIRYVRTHPQDCTIDELDQEVGRG